MIKSMTAFGRARETVGGKDITVELKSVNSRFFDCSVRLPKAFSYLEEKIRPYLQAYGKISRGKLDVSVGIDVIDTPGIKISIDEGYAAGYIAALRRLRDEFGLKDDISVMSVAQNRDIFVTAAPEDNAEREWEDVRSVLDKALKIFSEGRAREGNNLENDLKVKINTLRAYADEIGKRSRENTSAYRVKLEERLREMLSDNKLTFDESRILTECAIFADRVAIDEELVRLASHFDGFTAILDSGEPAGRRLDFLVQEINREANTIGSKCSDAAIARTVVDMKCEIEKIREQIQNIE